MHQLSGFLTVASLRLSATLLSLGLWVTGSEACELCLQAANERTNLVDQLAFARRVALASPEGETGQMRITVTIKGDGEPGSLVAVPLDADPFPTATEERQSAMGPTREPFLLVGDGIRLGWTNLGTIGVENADWLRELAATAIRPDIDPVQGTIRIEQGSEAAQAPLWRERVQRALPHLGGKLPTLERELAWSEIIRSPYGSLAVVAGRLRPDEVAEWLDDPAFGSHVGGVLHLYGYVGGKPGAIRIRGRLMRAAAAHQSAELGPLLTADLELEGPAQVDWIEATYFADRSRSLAEIQAALFALTLQGQANATIPRVRVIASLRRFIAERPAMADSVALTLADWACWEAKEDFEAVLASGAITDPASTFTVALYLKRAEAALQSSGVGR